MKKKSLINLFTVGLLISLMPVVSFGADSLLNLENPTISELRTEIEMLKRRIEVLEEQKDELTLALPQKSIPADQKVPENWREFDFQGQTYYVIPLKFSPGE